MSGRAFAFDAPWRARRWGALDASAAAGTHSTPVLLSELSPGTALVCDAKLVTTAGAVIDQAVLRESLPAETRAAAANGSSSHTALFAAVGAGAVVVAAGAILLGVYFVAPTNIGSPTFSQ